MEDQTLKQLITEAIMAMKAGLKIGEDASQDLMSNAGNEQLKAALKKSNETATKWKKRVERSIEEVGGGDERENRIVEANYEVAKEIVNRAPDKYSQDLGLIATSQLSMHYWIATFGTFVNYCKQAGLDQAQKEFQASLDEAKQADEEYNQIANSIMAEKQ